MRRTLSCLLISTAGLAALAGARWAGARPHVRHATGTLAVEVRDDRGAALPARLTFRPVGNTPKLFFTTIDIGREEAGAIAAFDRAFVLRGDAALRVPEGSYDVWVSHGPEWDAARYRVAIKAGAETELRARLRHAIDTPGWISGDFHVHSATSLDSKVPMRDRVYQFVADGVDLIVATDHNVVADYAPVINELGVRDLLASATGDEITTKQWGHFGAFPLPVDEPGAAGRGSAAERQRGVVDESEPERGAIATAKRTAAQIFADVRARAPAALIDVHHPRLLRGKLGYFALAELDLATGRAKAPGFSFDFDAIEVLNGYQDSDRRTMNAVIGDWLSFLDAGKRVACTGNSDSHHLTFNLGGYPRNYVATDEPIARLDPAKIAAQVKAGHSFFTTGPIVEATIAGKSYGDVAQVPAGTKLVLRVTVRAANWIGVSRVTVIGPGNTVLASRAIPPSTAAVRLDDAIELDEPGAAGRGSAAGWQRGVADEPGAAGRGSAAGWQRGVADVPGDGYAIVRVDGDRPMAPNVGDENSFLVYPVALTNPIWIDRDGDGAIKPRAPYPPAPTTSPLRAPPAPLAPLGPPSLAP